MGKKLGNGDEWTINMPEPIQEGGTGVHHHDKGNYDAKNFDAHHSKRVHEDAKTAEGPLD